MEIEWNTYLDSETTVDLGNALVVFPYYAELQDALGDLNDLKGFFISRVCSEEGLQTRFQLMEGLTKIVSTSAVMRLFSSSLAQIRAHEEEPSLKIR